MEEQFFIQEILEHPDDDAPRLIYADWLEDRGDPRAEFIRIQCQLADPYDEEIDREELAWRLRRLEDEYEEQWADGIGQYVLSYTFRRGFIEYVEITAERFVERADRLFHSNPITAVTIRGVDRQQGMRQFAECPFVERLTAIGFARSGRAGRLLGVLCESPYIGNIQRLALSQCDVDDRGLGAIANCERLKGLTFLDVTENRIRNAGISRLAQSAYMANLEILLAGDNEIRLTGARELAASPHLNRLKYLELPGNPIDHRGVEALRERFGREVVRV